MENFIFYVVFPLVGMAVAWFSRTMYNKYVGERPKLNLQISTEFTSRRIFPNNSYMLTWRYECILKNVSEYTAWNISISEVYHKDLLPLFDGVKEGNKMFGEQSHLDKNEEKRFEITTSFLTKPDELRRYTIENGEKTYYPGLSIPNPELYFRPKRLDEFSLLIRYQTSKRVSFYTLFKKRNKETINKYLRRKRPQ